MCHDLVSRAFFAIKLRDGRDGRTYQKYSEYPGASCRVKYDEMFSFKQRFQISRKQEVFLVNFQTFGKLKVYW